MYLDPSLCLLVCFGFVYLLWFGEMIASGNSSNFSSCWREGTTLLQVLLKWISMNVTWVSFCVELRIVFFVSFFTEIVTLQLSFHYQVQGCFQGTHKR